MFSFYFVIFFFQSYIFFIDPGDLSPYLKLIRISEGLI
jgi:hypothetical protein